MLQVLAVSTSDQEDIRRQQAREIVLACLRCTYMHIRVPALISFHAFNIVLFPSSWLDVHGRCIETGFLGTTDGTGKRRVDDGVL